MVLVTELKKIKLSNGETLGYRERSGGTIPLLLVHGNMTSSKHWDVLIDSLDSKYNVFAVDMRGFGISTYINPIHSIKDFSDDIKLFVDQLKLEEFAMIGWSTGGAVGMQFCADYPGLCHSLILLSSASTKGYPFYGTTSDGLPDLENRLKTIEEVREDTGKTVAVQTAYDSENREFLKAMWNMLIYRNVQPSTEKYEEYVDDMLTQRNLAEVYHSLNTFNISSSFNGLTEGTNQAKDITIPVLVLRGNEDLVVTAEMTKEILEDIGENATFKELTGCGHSPLIDNLELLKNTIQEFFERREQENYETTR